MADRRPDTDDYTRVKRQKTSAAADMVSRASEDGGVSLDSKDWGNYKSTPYKAAKPEKDAGVKLDPDLAPTRPKLSESSSRLYSKVQVKEEPVESKYTVYLDQTKMDPSESESKDWSTRTKAESMDTKSIPASSSITKEPADTKYNPYLAHMDEQTDDTLGYSNGYGHGMKTSRMNGMSSGTTIGHFPRHETTAAMAKKAEDGPNNPFNGKPLSTQYFNILKTRRNLPVHAQRSVSHHME